MFCDHIESEKPVYSLNIFYKSIFGSGFWLSVLLLSLRTLNLVTEVSVEVQPLAFLLIQQEAVYVGEQLLLRYGSNEAFTVQPPLIQQHHAEVGSGDSEGLPEERIQAVLRPAQFIALNVITEKKLLLGKKKTSKPLS